MRTTAVVTVEHVYQLIEARYEAMPVIAIAEATIFVVPEPVAEHFGMTVLATYRDMITFMAEHRSGQLAELFAATVNEAHGLGLIDETGNYTVSVALTDDVADNGRSTVEVLRREQIGEVDGEAVYALGGRIAGWTIPVPTDADDVIDQALTAAEDVLAEHGWQTAGPWEIADSNAHAPVTRG